MDRFMREVRRTLIGAYPWRPSMGRRFLHPLSPNRAGARIATGQRRGAAVGANLQIWRVLAALREQDASAWAICRHTSIEVSTLTRLVDNMEHKAWSSAAGAEDARPSC